jgi:5-oxoprolinase (ATP-hydrolysing)
MPRPPSPTEPAPRPWRIFVDTGGTFTDCLALDPAGQLHRAKVLSSGALRAILAEQPGDRSIVLEAPWLGRTDALPGFNVRPDGRGSGARVTHARPLAGPTLRARLELDAPLPRLSNGATLQLDSGEEAPVLAARLVTGSPPGKALPPVHLRLATTRGTNALLQRRGGPVALFVTEGFADLLAIGDQTRPDLFALRVTRPEPLPATTIEVPERLDARGRIVRPLDETALRRPAERAVASGIRCAAVALAHAWRNPEHERRVRDALLALGYEHVSLSSDQAAAPGLLGRAQTAVVNAFLAPVIDRYLDRVARPLGEGSSLLVMTSAGGLVERADFAPKDSLLSGPAGGVVGAAGAGQAAGDQRIITFDMGGTSTDVARCRPEPERVYQTRVGDAVVLAPAVGVETVAAGGGSVCSAERGELRVGPESAGADPGPACYARGGPLTLTDCNLLLGRLDPRRFALPLDPEAARARAEEALAEARRADPALTLEAMLEGFLAIADQRMAEAVRRITLRRGHDPRDHTLVAFGGAGPQHACAIAHALGIGRVLVPADAGLLSARGLALAPLEREAEAALLAPLDETLPGLAQTLDRLGRRAASGLPEPSRPGRPPPTLSRTVELRYTGQDELLELPAEPPSTLAERFADRYRAVFGFAPEGLGIEAVRARVVARAEAEDHAGATPPARDAQAPPSPTPSPPPPRQARVYDRAWRDARALERDTLRPGDLVPGPALITEPHATTFLPEGWSARRTDAGDLLLIPRGGAPEPAHAATVEMELGIGKLTAIAEEMGERLRRAAISTNVKQRRDFSCALLDAEGRLMVNAPHVPVHLGSMGVCVRALRDRLGPDLAHATVVTNHPACGGSHLPDVTLVQAVHDQQGRLLGYAAARAHHAEIGGIAPGSMAPDATSLAQEGVVIPPTPLADHAPTEDHTTAGPTTAGPTTGGRATGGRAFQPATPHVDWPAARALFTRGPHPSRDPDTNLRDLAAAAHAVWAGAEGLRALGHALGTDGLASLSTVIRQRAGARASEAIARLPDGRFEHAEPVLGGGPVRVRIEVRGERLVVDASGSGPVHPGCLNATPAILTSAVVYLVRLLIDEPLPLNEGLLEPVEIRPGDGMLNPRFGELDGPAVAGGNVEISQLLVECMLSALGLCAQSQGTMNNVVFGDETFGFYETLGGGCGAGPGWPGASTVHSHMTNTALPDVEILELRHPVRIEATRRRAGSGGTGTHAGGDGLERIYRFLAPVRVGLLRGRTTGARPLGPASPGRQGSATLIGPDGMESTLGNTTVSASPDTTLRVCTPGGGGCAR